ncbi:MAG: zinc ribbon domain-containing protein [Candidatus Asgardarchaeia archaeon]
MSIPKRRGYVILNHQVYPAEEIIAAINEQGVAEFNFEGHILIIGKRRIFPIRFSNLEEIMKLTCYGSLAYCCSPDFECAIRDEVLRLLGLTKEDYARLKAQHHVEFIKLAREKSEYSSSYPSLHETQSFNNSSRFKLNSSYRKESNAIHSISSIFSESFPDSNTSNQDESKHIKFNERYSSNYIRCPNCGFLVRKGVTYCPKCGYVLQKPL